MNRQNDTPASPQQRMTVEQFKHNGFSAYDVAKRWGGAMGFELAREIRAWAEAFADQDRRELEARAETAESRLERAEERADKWQAQANLDALARERAEREREGKPTPDGSALMNPTAHQQEWIKAVEAAGCQIEGFDPVELTNVRANAVERAAESRLRELEETLRKIVNVCGDDSVVDAGFVKALALAALRKGETDGNGVE